MPSVKLALDHVNEHSTVLRNYRLHMWWNDTMVSLVHYLSTWAICRRKLNLVVNFGILLGREDSCGGLFYLGSPFSGFPTKYDGFSSENLSFFLLTEPPLNSVVYNTAIAARGVLNDILLNQEWEFGYCDFFYSIRSKIHESIICSVYMQCVHVFCHYIFFMSLHSNAKSY